MIEPQPAILLPVEHLAGFDVLLDADAAQHGDLLVGQERNAGARSASVFSITAAIAMSEA